MRSSGWVMWISSLFLWGTALAKDEPFPNLQLMQFDWKGSDKEAIDAAKKSMAAAGFKVSGGNASAVVGEIAPSMAEGWVLAQAKTPSLSSVAIVCIAPDPMEAMMHATKLRSEMGKTPAAGMEKAQTYSAIWAQDGEPDKLKPTTSVKSFTWHGQPDIAGFAAERGMREMGFTNIKGGGINPARSGSKARGQMMAVVTYAPIDDSSARVHVLVTGYGHQDQIENYCRDLKALIEYDGEDQPFAPANNLTKTVDDAVEKVMKEGHIPGMAVGVLTHNKIEYLRGYGLAQGYEEPEGSAKRVAVTEHTVFRWGSVIKTVTAVTALRLMEEGKLDLNEPVQHYVPTFPAKENPVTHQPAVITPRLLLSHQSGLPHYPGTDADLKTLGPDKDFVHPDSGFKLKADNTNPMNSLGVFEQSTLMFPPGEREHYSSYGYMLLSAVIQGAAGGKPFEEVMNSVTIAPLGLSSLKIDHTAGAAPAGHAEGYTHDIDAKVVVKPQEDDAWRTGAGAYAGDVTDLARWAEALLQKKILKPATYQMAWQDEPLKDGTASKRGLGFAVVTDNGHLKVSHGGLADVALTQMTLFPDEGEAVVILCNCVPSHGKDDKGKPWSYGGPDLAKLARDLHDLTHTK